MKKLFFAIIALIFVFSSNAPAFSHGGGLDWQGGHNCRVGSCAGTYHCHQARAGICAKQLSSTTKQKKDKTSPPNTKQKKNKKNKKNGR